MRSIAVINQKGGVGKTTTAVNLAAALAELGKRACVVDLDPQAHASLHLGCSLTEGEESMYQVLVSDTPLARMRRRISERLWLAPAHLDLAAAELELAGEVGREMILRDKMMDEDALCDGDEEFDFLIVDCPPSLGVLTLNALTAVDEVFLPLQPHFLALHGLSKLLRTVDLVSKRLNPTLRLTGVVFCMFDGGTRLATEVTNDVNDFFARQSTRDSIWSRAKTFQTKIRRNIRLAEAPSFGQSIFEYARGSNGAEDYLNLARETLGLPVLAAAAA